MNTHNLPIWLNLVHAPNFGVARYKKLLDHFESFANFTKASKSELKSLKLSPELLDWLLHPRWELITPDLEWLKLPQHQLLTLDNPLYPPLLLETADPPLALFIAGDPQLLHTPQLAIIGSRNPSPTGLDNAFDFAKTLAQANLTITSGLALGIDSAGHKGALAGKGRTIAVMGTGLNQLYPHRNRPLATKILASGGTLVSEFSVNTKPKPQNFPRRNRIISGLSLGTVVIEATMRSGSLITARLACEQNREVFAIPGSIHNPLARGCHQLIQQGAKLVETAQDILEELQIHTAQPQTQEHLPIAPAKKPELAPAGKNLLQYLGDEPTPVDILVERSGLSVNKISSTLLILELQGYIKSTTGGFILLRRKSRL